MIIVFCLGQYVLNKKRPIVSSFVVREYWRSYEVDEFSVATCFLLVVYIGWLLTNLKDYRYVGKRKNLNLRGL